MLTVEQKITGMLLGTAIGDALGMPVETFTPNRIRETYGSVVEYHKPDKHKWFDGREAGTTTDDTQLTVAVAEALIERKGFDMDTMVAHHVKALEEDSGWGRGTRTAVEALRDGEHRSRSGQGDPAAEHGPGTGNGIAMKIAPMAAYSLLHSSHSESMVSMIVDRCIKLAMMTHRTDVGIYTGVVHAIFLDKLLRTQPDKFSITEFKGFVAKMSYDWLPECMVKRMLVATGRVPEITNANFMLNDSAKYLSGVDGDDRARFTCLVSYPVTMHAFLCKHYIWTTLVDVINAGGDTDTNASMLGAMIGALHGPAIFPPHLVEGLKDKDKIFDLSNRLFKTMSKFQ